MFGYTLIVGRYFPGYAKNKSSSESSRPGKYFPFAKTIIPQIVNIVKIFFTNH